VRSSLGSRRRRGCPGALLESVIAWPLVAAGLFAFPLPARAQAPRLEVDLSAMRIEYDTLAALDAPSLSALAEWLGASTFARLSGSVTDLEGAGWSLQGRANLAGWLAPLGLLSPLRMELAGTAAGSRHSSDFDSFVAQADARVHLRARATGAWAGLGLATARNSFDAAAVRGVAPALGAWAQTGGLRGSLSLLATRVAGETHPEANAAVAYTRGRADVTLWAGLRRSPFEDARLDEAWAGASGALWVGDRVALTVSGGRYSSDILQGLPGGSFVSVGLKVTPRRVRPVPVLAPAPLVYTSDEVRSGGVGFRVAGADRVEVAGDWNGWLPEPLARDDSGRWVLPRALDPGVYRFNLRVDGERWVVPDEVPSIDDGFGGRVGLLIVSGEESSL
jgi:hypothetical protein